MSFWKGVLNLLEGLFETAVSQTLQNGDAEVRDTYRKIERAKQSEEYQTDPAFREKVHAAERVNLERVHKINGLNSEAEQYNAKKEEFLNRY